jgi:hypothetical protein
MPGSETARHLELKGLALRWALRQGFTIAAAEVSVPRLGRCRLDVAAYRPAARSSAALPLGITAVFECKQSRSDFLRDTACERALIARLAKLAGRRQLYEEYLRRHQPSLCHGNELFPEFDGYCFAEAGYEPYDRLLLEMAELSGRLHARTKFARLARWKAANLHFVVAEPGVARACELPAGWGLLERAGEELALGQHALWHPAAEEHRWNLLLQIGRSGSREVRRRYGVIKTSEKEA